MAEKAWELSGQYMESCNCDYLCPCIYTNPQGEATHEHCYALMAYRIDRGRHGTVSLDGLKFAFVIRSGRIMADGGWVFGVVDPLRSGELVATLTVDDGAVATSGTAARGHHLWDGRTGAPAAGLASLTVTGPHLAWADALATAGFAMGTEGVAWVARFDGYHAVAVDLDGRLVADDELAAHAIT